MCVMITASSLVLFTTPMAYICATIATVHSHLREFECGVINEHVNVVRERKAVLPKWSTNNRLA